MQLEQETKMLPLLQVPQEGNCNPGIVRSSGRGTLPVAMAAPITKRDISVADFPPVYIGILHPRAVVYKINASFLGRSL